MAANTAGYVPILGQFNPRTITGKAGDAIISGGDFVTASGATGVVSSGANSFATSDLKFAGTADASGLAFTGIATQTAGSNATITVMTRGAVIVTADGDVTAGYPVGIKGNDAVHNIVAGSTTASAYGVGRALTTATSGTLCVVDFGRV